MDHGFGVSNQQSYGYSGMGSTAEDTRVNNQYSYAGIERHNTIQHENNPSMT